MTSDVSFLKAYQAHLRVERGVRCLPNSHTVCSRCGAVVVRTCSEKENRSQKAAEPTKVYNAESTQNKLRRGNPLPTAVAVGEEVPTVPCSSEIPRAARRYNDAGLVSQLGSAPKGFAFTPT